MFKIAVILVTLYAVFTSAQDSKACSCEVTSEYRPVCGSDNMTYRNPTVITCSNICLKTRLKIKSIYPCPCDCERSDAYDPVCADDDRTYLNPQTVNCFNRCSHEKVSVKFRGECRPGENPVTDYF